MKKAIAIISGLVVVAAIILALPTPAGATGETSEELTCPQGTTQNFVETVTVPANKDTETLSSAVLQNGKNYILKAYGTACAEENAPPICTIFFDAEYSQNVNGATQQWVDGVEGYENYGLDLLDLKVNDGFVNWGAYNAKHIYWDSVVGAGSPLSLKVYDIYYPNDTGNLLVDIYSCNPIPTTGTISGMKYNDLNRNGKKDANEPGLAGWTIRLLLDDPITDKDTVVATAITDANGNYTFSNVAPGTYDVREVHQKGWKRTSKNPKDVVLTVGSDVTGIDFGNAVIKKCEKEDNDQDDNRNDQSGKYYCNHGPCNYDKDQDNPDHAFPGINWPQDHNEHGKGR